MMNCWGPHRLQVCACKHIFAMQHLQASGSPEHLLMRHACHCIAQGTYATLPGPVMHDHDMQLMILFFLHKAEEAFR